jgi:hypothetical protein
MNINSGYTIPTKSGCDDYIMIKIDRAFKQRAKRAARKERIAMSEWIRQLMAAAIERERAA